MRAAIEGRGVRVAGPSPLLSADPHPSSPPAASAIYEGWVRHRRFAPIEHEFSYRLFLMYLDLAELPEVLDPFPLFSARGRALARFRREDFMGDPARPLDECTRRTVEKATGARPAGPVRLLAGLRYFGHSFNPVSFYYCFDPAGERVEAVVADVQNIPWGERHPYVLARGERRGSVLGDELEKTLHVSPLMGMDQTYAFRAGEPGERLVVHIESRPRETAVTRNSSGSSRSRGTAKEFDATLSLRRRELSRRTLTTMLARYPALSLQVVAKIYAQSLRLKLKGARYHPHPEGSRPKGFVSP
ncbi:MAG TPA: DUF1365 domain-containing protein [Solirubrobacterales bacterium]|nr:DUF1365 domain-containing protein [Solirubrobacterales bacterium]